MSIQTPILRAGKRGPEMVRVPRALRRGRLVSVWYRRSRRHRWIMEYSMARVLSYARNPDGSVRTIRLQLSDTWCHGNGATTVMLRGIGSWERELRPMSRMEGKP